MSKESTLQIIFGGKHWRKETSPYGWRVHPITGNKKFHYGSDFSCNKVPVYAIEAGTVYKRGYDKSAGNYIYVYYSRLGVCVAYFHLTSVAVAKGAKVKKGTKVGVAGTTGGSTGVHLHVGVRVKSTWKWTNSDTWLSNYTPKQSAKQTYKGGFPTITVNAKSGNRLNIKRWQGFLRWAGFYKGELDGSFGAQTVKATKAFQKAVALTPDGSAGIKTRTKAKAYKK